ncbi:diguanylate cyclase [Pseudomarimonas arenosa]|uniref:diguanylate cyclase n=1 Tax=Pseudomarimonas arenosa TaxID=2774145 RepID=A0AAW3ZFW8_9GAMM|nr:diguanylate cyclase [Pseudomarimonas arenosa]
MSYLRLLLPGLVLALTLGSAHARLDPDAQTQPEIEQEVEGATGVSARLLDASRRAERGDAEGAVAVLQQAAIDFSDPLSLDLIDRRRAQIAFRSGDYAEARQRYAQVLERAAKRRDSAALARAEADIALLDRRTGDLGAAMAGLERALGLFRQLGDRDGMASMLTHLALIRLNKGDYSAALEALNESLRLQSEGAKAELERTYHYLGLLYAGLREYETARTHLDRGLSEARRLGDPNREAPLLGSIARVANLSRDYSRALSWALDAERLAERMDSPPGRAYAALERGRALLGMGQVQEARDVLEKGAAIAERISQSGTLADFRAELARIAALEGRIDDAIALWDTALGYFQSGDDRPQLYTSYRELLPLLVQAGESARALALAQEGLRLQEEISGLDMNRRLAVLESENRAREAQREIEILKRDNEISSMRLREERNQRWTGWAISLSLLAVLAMLALRYRESRRSALALGASNAALQQSQAALQAAHHQLEQKAELLAMAASTDPLTGISNRREFSRRFGEHWRQASEQGRDLSLVLLDVDHFKQVNDKFGHAAGDSVLTEVAEVLRNALRGGTALARWGGEEFAVLLPNVDRDQAAALADRLRQAVASMPVRELPSITISAGVASLEGRRLNRPEQLLDEADAALYQAKTLGRNRVVLAGQATPR